MKPQTIFANVASIENVLSEQEFIDREQAKSDKRLLRLLRKVERTGVCGRGASEVLAIADLAHFGGPRPGVNAYNCHHLTDKGKALLSEPGGPGTKEEEP